MLLSRKHKEKVIIISGNTVIKKKKCVLEGNTVIIEKGKKGAGNVGWKVNAKPEDYKYYRNRLGFLKRKLEIKVDAKKFIPFGTMTDKDKIPTCTRKDVMEYGNATILKRAGMSTQKIEVPLPFYLIVGAVFVMQIIIFMNSQGMFIQ